MDLERQLRDSLAAREPGAEFEMRVMARLARRRTAPPGRVRNWRLPVAVAASVFAAGFALQWHLARQREARAHEQMLLAMQITSFELNRLQQRLEHDAIQEK